MSLLSRDVPPPIDTHDTLREWRMQPYSKRFRVGLSVMVRVVSAVLALAGIALMIAEPSLRSAALIGVLWLVGVPITALGYVRKMDRMAALVPITPASTSPTTTVDIRRDAQ
jgi:hypothetical protein